MSKPFFSPRSRYSRSKMKCFGFSTQKRSLSSSSKATTRKNKKGKSKEDSIRAVLESLGSVQMFSHKELEESSKGFRSSNKIGEGGFGSVYMGILHDGTVVALKVLSAESRQGDAEFVAEIRAMWNVRHENLVQLLGVCVDGDNRILVYEYMENLSLAQTLLGGERYKMNFRWNIRRGICLGIARGLAYLHEEVKPHIVHRDIKASNILLDEDFKPKISDFGLAKLFPDNISHLSTRVAGTLGYLAPEYAISGHLTRKSDVYSFGVLVLEVLSGRSAVGFDLELGEYCLVDKAWNTYNSGELLSFMDPILMEDFDQAEAILFLKVGLLCVQENPGLRPKMSKAMKLMISDEMDIEEVKITKPAVITDLMKLKMAGRPSAQSPSSKFSSTSNSTQSSVSRFFKSGQMQNLPS